MKRRDVIAGIGSLGVLAGAGIAATRGPELLDSSDGGDTSDVGTQVDGTTNGDLGDPIELEAVEAPGSEAGTLTVPERGQPMVVDFFATTCGVCESVMPTMVEAESSADGVTFLSVTIERDPELIRDWWEEYEGDWPVAMDPGIDLYEGYGVTATPTTIAIDGTGEVHWRSEGTKELEDVLAGAEAASEATADEA